MLPHLLIKSNNYLTNPHISDQERLLELLLGLFLLTILFLSRLPLLLRLRPAFFTGLPLRLRLRRSLVFLLCFGELDLETLFF